MKNVYFKNKVFLVPPFLRTIIKEQVNPISKCTLLNKNQKRLGLWGRWDKIPHPQFRALLFRIWCCSFKNCPLNSLSESKVADEKNIIFHAKSTPSIWRQRLSQLYFLYPFLWSALSWGRYVSTENKNKKRSRL